MKKNYKFQENEKLIIKERNRIHQISISEIEYIHSEAGITIINTIDKNKIILSKNLKYFEKQLVDFEFEKANRNEIVNCAFISKFDMKRREVKINDKIIRISYRNLKNFTKKFKKYRYSWTK